MSELREALRREAECVSLLVDERFKVSFWRTATAVTATLGLLGLLL